MKRLGILLFVTILLGLIYPAAVVLAQGLGLSGNFYKQHFELSPGQTTSEQDIYVVVSNPDENSARVKIITDAPSGVVIHLTQDDFLLDSGQQQKVNISVEASVQAIPGDYTLTISAEAVREGTGIKINAGTRQQAPLSILGEAGQVTVNTVNGAGESLALGIDIYEIIDSNITKVRSGQGTLVSRLKPGDYVARSSYQNIVLAEQAFSLVNKESKEIILTCPTICVSGFTLTPNNSTDDKLISLKIGYTISNLQEPLQDVRAVLKVRLDDEDFDETELTSFSQMGVGSQSGTYNYSPAQGWQQKHKYSFIMELYSKDILQYSSQQQDMVAGDTLLSTTTSLPEENKTNTSNKVNWTLIGGVIAGIVIIAIIVILLIRRRSAH